MTPLQFYGAIRTVKRMFYFDHPSNSFMVNYLHTVDAFDGSDTFEWNLKRINKYPHTARAMDFHKLMKDINYDPLNAL
jgi:hypothetical protein